MVELILLALALFLGGSLVTLLLCRLTRNRLRFLRLLPLLPVGVLWVYAWLDYNGSGWFSGLAAFADFIGGVLILLGWGAALLLVRRKRRKTPCQTEENSGS